MEIVSHNHKTNKKKRERREYKKRSKIFEESKLEAFQSDNIITSYLSSVINKSEFIRKAIYFYIHYLNNPEKVMKELKFKYPELYKQVGRKKF